MTPITTEISKEIISAASKYGSEYLLPIAQPLEQQARLFFNDFRPDLLKQYDSVLKTGHPLSKNFPLMNPFHVFLLLLAYFVVVFGGKYLMRLKKEPFKPKLFQIIHNLVLVVLSAYMAFEAINQALLNKYTLFQNPVAASDGMARIVWIFYASKVLEFIDTFIMVLKKSERQISFLHVYHHTTIFAIWWAVTKWGPGGDAYFSVVLNSSVHVIMYSYYLSTTIGIPLNFIKPYITSIQMTQFMAMIVQASYDLFFGCPGYPKALIILLFVYMNTLLILFANFFIQDRRARKQAARAKKEGKKNK